MVVHMYATTESPRPSSLLRRPGLLPGRGEPATVPDGWQASLFGLADPSIDATFAGIDRIHLDDTSWVDHLPLWLAGADLVFGELVARLPWRHRDVVMYDRVLPEPRLTSWWSEADDGAEPLPVLADIRHALTDRYARHFDSIGCNYYRDGNDSVAWHGDTVRKVYVDPLVAIVSVGSPRPFHLRPRGGGSSRSFELGLGDLLVMGGACQHDWEHSVPKVRHAGPRLSITFRHGRERAALAALARVAALRTRFLRGPPAHCTGRLTMAERLVRLVRDLRAGELQHGVGGARRSGAVQLRARRARAVDRGRLRLLPAHGGRAADPRRGWWRHRQQHRSWSRGGRARRCTRRWSTAAT